MAASAGLMATASAAVMIVLATAAVAAVRLISNATATLTRAQQSAADGGPDGDDGSVAIAMQ